MYYQHFMLVDFIYSCRKRTEILKKATKPVSLPYSNGCKLFSNAFPSILFCQTSWIISSLAHSIAEYGWRGNDAHAIEIGGAKTFGRFPAAVNSVESILSMCETKNSSCNFACRCHHRHVDLYAVCIYPTKLCRCMALTAIKHPTAFLKFAYL